MTKTLLVFRHAQAVHSNEFVDHERPLTKQGVREARRSGRLLRGLKPDAVLCSTSLRTRSTLEHALKVAQLNPKVQYLDDLYDSDVERHLESLRHADASANRLLVVGHNPTLETFVSQLVSRPITLATGSLAVIAVSLQSWQSVEPSTQSVLVGLFDPAMLKKKVASAQSWS